MQPMGREKIKFPSKMDCHCKKDGLVNWWEDEHQPSKKRERQKAKNDIRKETSERENGEM